VKSGNEVENAGEKQSTRKALAQNVVRWSLALEIRPDHIDTAGHGKYVCKQDIGFVAGKRLVDGDDIDDG